MSNRYMRIGMGLTLAVAVTLILVSCGTKKEGAGIKLDDDLTQLVHSYQQMKEIGLAGQVDQFLAMRDSLTNGEIDEYFKRKGWEIDSAKVSSWAYSWPDIAGQPLVQDSINGEWRRLMFRRCGLYDDKNKEQCLYSIIMLRKNGDEWRVSNASRLSAYRYNPDGTEVHLDQLTFHKMFRLPPSFIDLKPKEGPSQIQFHPINPEDTVSNK